MKIRFRPTPTPRRFVPFDGLDLAALKVAKAAKRAACARGTRRDAKTGKCLPPRKTK